MLPFELSGACATYNRIVNKLLERFRHFSSSYFDDVLIFNSSWSSQFPDVSNVLNIIKEVGLNLNRYKCEFGNAVIDFLCFRVGLGRIEPRQRKVEAIVNFSRPTFRNKSPNDAVSHHIIKRFFHILRLLLPKLQTYFRKQIVYLIG